MILLQSTGISLTPSRTLIALFIPLLLIIPGVAGLQVSLWTTRRTDTFSQLERLVLSALISLGSLFLLYVVWSVIRWTPVSYEMISTLSLVAVVCGYILHFATAAFVGVIAGSFAYNYYLGNSPSSMYDSWEYLFTLRNEGDDVKIRTTSGLWLKGHVHQVMNNGTSRDLLLDNVEVLALTETQATQEGEGESASDESGQQDDTQQEISEDDSFEELEAKLDEQIDSQLQDYSEVEDARSTKQLQYLHLEGSEIEAIGQNEDITEGFDEEIDAMDRLQRRTGSIASVFGYESLELGLVALFRRANSKWGRLLTSLTFVLTMGITVGFQAPVETIVGVPSTDILTVVAVALLTMVYLEFGQSLLDSGEQNLRRLSKGFAVGTTLVGFVFIVVSVTRYPMWRSLGAVGAGILAAVPVSSVVNRIRHQYTQTISVTTTVIILACIGIAVPAISGHTIPPTYGQTLIGLGVCAGIVLFIERIRTGQPEPFQEWPRVLADILAIGFAVSATVLLIRAVSRFSNLGSGSPWGAVSTLLGAGIFTVLAVGYGREVREE